VDNGHIDVLLLTQHDWANSVYRLSKCLEMLGLNVVAFKGEKHLFDYPDELPIHPAIEGRPPNTYHYVPHLKAYADQAKALHFCTSTFIDSGVDPFSKNIVIQHGGTMYRVVHPYLNSFYNHFVDATILQTPDLLGLGADKEILITSSVQADAIKPRYRRIKKDKIVIGHFPRHPKVKGSHRILETLDALLETDLGKKFEYVYSTDTVSWPDNLKRMAKCDVIMETCRPEQHGRKFGEWGNTALEAAALGKIVITNSLSIDAYIQEYGKPELLIANNKRELESKLLNVFDWPAEFLAQKKRKTRKWVEDNHSIEATGKRLWKKVYKSLLDGGNNG
jgi:glycosyltransferase involved in cell wall biosynthesis